MAGQCPWVKLGRQRRCDLVARPRANKEKLQSKRQSSNGRPAFLARCAFDANAQSFGPRRTGDETLDRVGESENDPFRLETLVVETSQPTHVSSPRGDVTRDEMHGLVEINPGIEIRKNSHHGTCPVDGEKTAMCSNLHSLTRERVGQRWQSNLGDVKNEPNKK